LYHQQNTSDDYVLVSSNDENLANHNQSKSPNNQSAQAKTFFTTLNQADLPPHRNINEFLNKCENDDDGINFLQDSEIQLRQQQDHLNQNELNYHQQQQGGGYNQDGSHPEGQQKDNQFKHRGGNRDHNGAPGNNQRQYQQRPRYTDDRRMGGGNQGMPPRNNGNGPLPPRNNSGSNQAPASSSSSFSGQRNPNNAYRSGSNSTQGNNNNNNNNNNNRGSGGYYRGGPANNNQGSGGYRNNNGPRPYQQRVNNHPENVHDNQQPQMA